MLIQVIKSSLDSCSLPAPLNLECAASDGDSAAKRLRSGNAGTDAHTALRGAFDHALPVPLYSQIRETLRARILDGTFRSNGKLPSESELVKAFDVSRITVRQALNDLQKEGLIFKLHGKGTFVSPRKAVQNLMRIEGFGEAMSAAGHQTHSRVLGCRVMRPGRYVAARLAIGDDVDVMEIRRVRYLDREA